MLRLLNPIRRLTASTYARGVAVMLVALTVGVLLTCNLCASRRYSVDEGEMVFIYGMPFAYRITRSLEAPPILTRRLGEPVTSDSRIAPPPLPAIMPFNLAAFAANAILAALIVLGLWFVVFHVLPRPSIKRSLNRGTVFLVAAGLVAAALFACVCALTRYERQRDLFTEIDCSWGMVWTEYPGPDVIWSTTRSVAQRFYSAEQIRKFLDASVGTVVVLRGPSNVLPYLPRLPSLKELIIAPDDVLRDMPPGALMFPDGLAISEPDDAKARERSRVALENVHISVERSSRLEGVSIGEGASEDRVRFTLKVIGQLPGLRFLNLNGKFNADSLRALHDLKTLECLYFGELTIPEGAIRFSEFPALRSLSLAGATITGDDGDGLTEKTVRDLERLHHLENLDLGGGGWSNENVVKRLGGLSSLRNLSLASYGVGDDDLESLAALTDLRFLDLSNNRFTVAGLKSLASLQKLEALGLQKTEITDEAVAALTALPNLQVLDLRDTEVTDASISSLLQIRSLRDIFLKGTHVTAAGGLRLKALPMLRTLTLNPRGAGLSAADLDELQRQLPNLDVLGELRLWPPSAARYDRFRREERWQ